MRFQPLSFVMALGSMVSLNGLAQERRMPVEGTLKVGDPTPALKAYDLATGDTKNLEELRGKPTLLIFGSCT